MLVQTEREGGRGLLSSSIFSSPMVKYMSPYVRVFGRNIIQLQMATFKLHMLYTYKQSDSTVGLEESGRRTALEGSLKGAIAESVSHLVAKHVS